MEGIYAYSRPEIGRGHMTNTCGAMDAVVRKGWYLDRDIEGRGSQYLGKSLLKTWWLEVQMSGECHAGPTRVSSFLYGSLSMQQESGQVHITLKRR